MIRRRSLFTAIAALLVIVPCTSVAAQGVTTSAISAIVRDAQGQPRPDVRVTAVHEPSGSRYQGRTRADGRVTLAGMRVGGPYRVTAAFIGLQSEMQQDVFLTLGVSTDLQFVMREAATQLGDVTVTGSSETFSESRTGAATFVSREALATLPTISGRLESVVRLTPQSGGGMSFAGQDSRLNNITVDGSYFNNSFGLASTPGDRTGVAPISLAAVEQVQVNVAPFDVRQGNFIGAAINTVTRSGTNNLRGSLYYSKRDESFVGTKAGSQKFDPGTFNYNNIGGWVAGPVIKNKLFYFLTYENEGLTEPGTTFRANTGTETVGGSVTRVKASDLDALSAFLKSKLNYDPGPYQGYSGETPAMRFLGKLDLNLNERNKVSLRYNHLDSHTDVLESNSSSLGFGSRRSNTTSLNFQNSNYQILENIRSIVGELNSTIGSNMANNLIAGYTYQDESRASRGTFFPLVDVLESGSTYTSFGFEPFTPSNELRYGTYQFQDNLTRYGVNHDLTFGVTAEKYHSENVFFPGSQSVYIYNSLADFYTDANDYLANPNRTLSPVTLRRFQVRWNNIPGSEKPLQPLDVVYTGLYGQDEWRVMPNLKVNVGLRVDVPFFGNTAFDNPSADALSFRDENGKTVKYSTGKLPDPKLLFSPRLGFNWDIRGDRSTQIRGGTGVFTGRPAYVWISNQIGNTGVLTGFQDLSNTKTRPFNPDPNHYKPTNVTGAPASSYELALTDPDFKFPQLWRTDLAVDQRLPFGLIGTAEFLYNRDVNGIYYINANLAPSNTQFSGADNRPRWTTSNRINSNVANAVVLKNANEGRSWNIAGSLEKPFSNGLYIKGAYSYGEAKNTVDPGSIAFGSWNNNQHAGDPNNPGLGFSGASPGHRLFTAASYRREYFRFGATTLSMFWQAATIGNAGYTYSGDLNGDGGFSNDLIYIPRDISEMNFQQFTSGSGASAKTFTSAQQAAAWEAYIGQDDYLKSHRGQYAVRGAVFLPMVNRADFSIAQEVFTDLAGKRNSLQIRADILNVGNLLNKNWGVGQRFVNTQPLIVPSSTQGGAADAQGRAQYRLRTINNELMTTSLEKTAGIGDVFRVQLGVRYTFN
ncbi:MAG: carboxypeptidase regulatory-like domain-containing protein [Gemmatimonadaceae bacterium]|nr:carboxypeptidase regulatory-like domain-containing protein [Gemmatimonadaceae bacterium]